MNKNAKAFIVAATEIYGKNAVLTRDQVKRVVEEKSVPFPFWFVTKSEFRTGERGKYILPNVYGDVQTQVVEQQETVTAVPALQQTNISNALRQYKLLDDSEASVPTKYPGFIPFGFFKDLIRIVESKSFFPVFITGLSGNGKTLMVEQVCATLKRECIRVNISVETDETDLIGSNTMVDGNIVYRDGPVITAMKRGAILLIDEIDRGSNKLMCMQGILEGKAYYNKKTGEYVQPKSGFNVIATANTKGRGSEEGRYLSQILDDAFLERFVLTVEQEYPTAKVEAKILSSLIQDSEFVENLVKWADVIRKTFAEGGIDEIISTRRLVHIAKTYDIFKDRKRSIELCVNRFDQETKDAFIDLYTKVDASVDSMNVSKNEDESVPEFSTPKEDDLSDVA